MVVGLRCADELKTQTSVKAKRFVVLKPNGKRNPFPVTVCHRDNVEQHSCADASVLILWLDLYFSYFDCVRLIEDLNHSHT